MERRQGGLDADGDLLRVETDGEVVQHDVDDVIPDLGGVVRVIRQGLVVGDEDVDLIIQAGVLQLHPTLQGTYIMTQVQPSGGTVPGKNNLFLLSHDTCHPSVLTFCIFYYKKGMGASTRLVLKGIRGFRGRAPRLFHPVSGTKPP